MLGKTKTALLSATICAAVVIGCKEDNTAPPATPKNPPAAASSAPSASSTAQTSGGFGPTTNVDVLLCDGKTHVTVAPGTPGTAIAGSLMAEWVAKHPGSTWEAEERERHTLVGAADNTGLVGQSAGQTYGKITAQDVDLWKTETERVATAGSSVFHDANQLGSTVGVSCDMCHPHAANTHPETYPKFQQQLGRVALLRDMINWCIEHPVRGKPLASDDPRMRALEAYITAQRKGKALEYGKH